MGSRRKNRDEDDDEDVSGNGPIDNDEMGEIFNEYTEVKHWMQEGIPPLRNLTFEDEDIISPISMNEGKPIEKDSTGYTGNAGMEMEYWYHYGAVFLWPRKYHYNMLVDLPLDNKLEWIAYYNACWDKLEITEIELIKKLIGNSFENKGAAELDFSPLAELLVNVDEKDYLFQKGNQLLIDHFSQISVESWVRLFEKYQAIFFEDIFTAIGMTRRPKELEHQLTILHHLSNSGDLFKEFVLHHIEKIPVYLQALDLPESGKDRGKNILREVLILSEMKSGDAGWQKKTAEAFTRKLSRDFVNEVVVSVIVKPGEKSILGRQILEAGVRDLRRRVDNKPKPPADWSRPVPVTGSDSKVWMMLAPFLQSASVQVFDYRAGESLRREVENAIGRVTIDLAMETIKKGSPYTLRLVKTQSAYERERGEWVSDEELLAKAEGWMKG
ncbi:MAG: hypothetical protein WKF89_03435 [Chitinophagaceae bacterium]